MEFKYKNYNVESENDFKEGGIDKIRTVLTVYFEIVGDSKYLPILNEQIIVINLNSQTGEEMDEQREEEAANFVKNII